MPQSMEIVVGTVEYVQKNVEILNQTPTFVHLYGRELTFNPRHVV